MNAKLISKAPFFSEVSNEALAAIVTSLTPLVFVPGQLLCSEGQRLSMIYFINRGKVVLLKSAGSDSEAVVREISDADGTASLTTAHELALCDWRRFSEVGLGGWGDGQANRRVQRLLDRLDGGKALASEQAYIEAMRREFPV